MFDLCSRIQGQSQKELQMDSFARRCVRKSHDAKVYSVKSSTISCKSRNWWEVQKARIVDWTTSKKASEIGVTWVQTKTWTIER